MYLKDAEVESRALIHTDEASQSMEVFGFYYTSESGTSYLTVETWTEAKWMRFYVGKEISSRSILSLGDAK